MSNKDAPDKYLTKQAHIFPEDEKKKWNRGIKGDWVEEPDLVAFFDKGTDMPCMIRRSSVTGSLCGYVGFTESDPLFGANYTEERFYGVSVHGGLTFSGQFNDVKSAMNDSKGDRMWWIGFDCGHYMDLSPALSSTAYPQQEGAYRNLPYVEAEVRSLAEQLNKIRSAWPWASDD